MSSTAADEAKKEPAIYLPTDRGFNFLEYVCLFLASLCGKRQGGGDGGGTHTCYCFVSLNLALRKSAWQAVRLAVKSDLYPPLNPYEMLAA